MAEGEQSFHSLSASDASILTSLLLLSLGLMSLQPALGPDAGGGWRSRHLPDLWPGNAGQLQLLQQLRDEPGKRPRASQPSRQDFHATSEPRKQEREEKRLELVRHVLRWRRRLACDAWQRTERKTGAAQAPGFSGSSRHRSWRLARIRFSAKDRLRPASPPRRVRSGSRSSSSSAPAAPRIKLSITAMARARSPNGPTGSTFMATFTSPRRSVS